MPRVRTELVNQIVQRLVRNEPGVDLSTLREEHGLDGSEMEAITQGFLRGTQSGRAKLSGPEPNPQVARRKREEARLQRQFEGRLIINQPPKR